jgi:hypothetical protein
MRRIALTVAAGLTAATVVAAGTDGTKYGAGVSLEKATPIAEVAGKPDQFVGKTVRIDGVVTAVCENMGCWMQLKDEKSGQALRVKVDDGVIVFPVSAKGKKASAQGVVEKVDVAAEAAHHAEMAKKEPAKEAHPAPTASYQLKATGALVF